MVKGKRRGEVSGSKFIPSTHAARRRRKKDNNGLTRGSEGLVMIERRRGRDKRKFKTMIAKHQRPVGPFV